MDSSSIVILVGTGIGTIGTMITVMVQGRKSRWIQEQMLDEARKTNGRIGRLEDGHHEVKTQVGILQARFEATLKK